MKKLFLILLLSMSLHAFKWEYKHQFLLKKDEVGQIKVKKRDDATVRILTLRWTLYQNERLVLLVNYDGFPTQYIVQNRYKRRSIKITLRDDYRQENKRCYAILAFKAFDAVKKVATIGAFISDSQKRIEIEFIDPKKSKG